VRIITRAEWQALPPRTVHRITLPTPELWLHHSAGPRGGAEQVRAIQRYHMSVRGWSDIAYSFLVNHQGVVFEGRGAGVAGGHTAGRNTISHAICAIGNYEVDQAPEPMVEAIAELTAHGVRSGWWASSITGPHRAAPGASTLCCGRHLIGQIPAIRTRVAALLAPPPPPATEETDDVDLWSYINAAYAEAGRPAGSDGSGRRYWFRTATAAASGAARADVLATMERLLGLKV
jgi:hypothetical protein